MQDNNLFASTEERLNKQVCRMGKLKNERLEKQPFTTDVWLKSVYVQKGFADYQRVDKCHGNIAGFQQID